MTSNARRALLLLALLAAAWLAHAWLNSDRRQIERRLSRLQDLVDKRPGESSLAGLNKARQITELFAPELHFRATPYRFEASDRQSLAAGIHHYRSLADRLTMRVTASELAIDRDLGRATMFLTAEFSGRFTGGGEREAYRFQVNWVDGESGWRIDYVDLLEILAARPGGFGF